MDNNIFSRMLNDLEGQIKQKSINEKTVNYILSAQNQLTDEQKERFENILPQINELIVPNQLEFSDKFKKFEEMIKNNQTPNEKDLQYILEHQEILTKEEKTKLNKMLPQINRLTSSNNEMIVKKDSILSKIPGIRKIYEYVQNRRIKNFENNLENSNNQQSINENNSKKEESFKERYKKENFKTEQPVEQQILVTSDFHGRIDKWEICKSMLKKDPSLTFVILGDAMDRGEYGPEILMEIKEASDNGRVKYLPGNHDIFAYNYIKTRGMNNEIQTEAKWCLENNGGKITIDKLNNFDQIVQKELKDGRIKKSISIDELMDWLGSQPIQDMVKINGKLECCLAHAVFDLELFNKNNKFALQDALDIELNGGDKELLDRFNNVMWYRHKDLDTHYAQLSWPGNAPVIVGHTTHYNVEAENNIEGNPNQAFIYVDCGKGENFEALDLTTLKIVKMNEAFKLRNQMDNINKQSSER